MYRSDLTVLHAVLTFQPMELRAGALFDPVQFVYPMTAEQIEERSDATRAGGDRPWCPRRGQSR